MDISSAASAVLSLSEHPTLADFRPLTTSILTVLSDPGIPRIVAAGASNHYIFHRFGTVLARPINTRLFIFQQDEFDRAFDQLVQLLAELRALRGEGQLSSSAQAFAEQRGIEGVLYTIAQACGTALDTTGSQSARKNAGIVFEKLIIAVLDEIGVGNARATLRIPVQIPAAAVQALRQAPKEGESDEETVAENDSEGGGVAVIGNTLTFGPEIDTIISPYQTVPLSTRDIDAREVLVSIKTTSKDRMAKIFVDRYIIQRNVPHDVKTVGIFLHDVQRAKSGVAATFVAGMFLVYRHIFGDLSGVYYIDPPVRSETGVWSVVIHPLRKFLLVDVWRLLA